MVKTIEAPNKEKEIQKLKTQIDSFDEKVKELTNEGMPSAPPQEVKEVQLSSREIAAARDIYLKPEKVIFSREKFNENYREKYNFQKEIVKFIAQHHEMEGEVIEVWTKPFAGLPAEFWKVPSNKPVYGPRYLAEQLARKSYNQLKMNENEVTGTNYAGQDTGRLVVSETKQRLSAKPAPKHVQVSMFNSEF